MQKYRLTTLAIVVFVLGALAAQAQWEPPNPATGASIYRTSRVGIGSTSAPAVALEVRSLGYDTMMHFWGSGEHFGTIDWGPSHKFLFFADLGHTLGLGADGNWHRMTIDLAGNVGIGTEAPAAMLHVAGEIRFGLSPATDLRMFADTAQPPGGPTYNQVTSITPATNPGSGTTLTAIWMKSATAVGQGTNQVDLVVDGNISAKFQDVAEWVPAVVAMEPGTVVVIDPEVVNHVLPSSKPYDTSVAGVVSAQPGLTLGVGSADKAKIATTGRVRVKVDATARPIHIGDLLVTSDKNGMAMKSEPMQINGRTFHQPGTVIGKALEPLREGQGEILVLLSLQ